MTVALAAVFVPWIAACALAVLPRGPVAAWVDLGASGATALFACAGLAADATAIPPLRFDGAAMLFLALIAVASVPRRWTMLRRLRCPADRRVAGQVQLGAMLLVCLLADPLLSWPALAIACAAALYPALPRCWDLVPLAGAGLGLALFGIIGLHAGAASILIAPAGQVLGYGLLAGLMPSLLIPLLALLLRLSPLPDGGAPMLIALGLIALLACGLWLLVRPVPSRHLRLLRLGQGGAAAVAFGLGGLNLSGFSPGGEAAIFAGLVQVTLLALSGAAADLGGRVGPERVAIAAGLAGLPPFGVFPGLVLIIAVVVQQAPWLLLPLGSGLAMLGWSAIIRLPSPRWTGPATAAPIWVPLGLVLLIGWFLPAGAADWLHAAAALTP